MKQKEDRLDTDEEDCAKTKQQSKDTKCNSRKKNRWHKEELSEAQIEEMREWFYFFDKNGDERLDIKELNTVFHALCWDLTNDELEEVMRDADTDGNGYLEYDEYMRLLYTYQKDPSQEKVELIQAFGYFDKDKNGYLDRGELTRLLLSYGEVYTKRDRQILDNFMESMDKNGDGKIDIEEFVEAMMMKPH